jgi:hypothetical protein
MECQAERRKLRIWVTELQLVAQWVGSKPEAVPEKELGRVTATGVGHCKQASTSVSFMFYVTLSELRGLSEFRMLHQAKHVARDASG